MPESDSRVVVELLARIDDLTKNLDKAQAEINKFKNESGKSMGDLGKMVSEVFAADKIYGFIKDGITGLASYERGLDNLTGKIKGAGQAFDGMRESLDGYARSAQSATRFSDDQVIGSLDKLMQRTQNLTMSYKLNEAAMNFAVFANTDLADASNTLGLAYQGNERGLMQLARALGITGDNAHNTQFIFDELERRTHGLARSEENLATNLEKAKNQIADAGKTLAEELAPAITTVAGWFSDGLPQALRYAIGWWQILTTTIYGVATTAIVIVKNMVDVVGDYYIALGKLMVNVWTHPIDAAKQFAKDVKAAFVDNAKDVQNWADAVGDSVTDTYNKMAAKEKAADKASHDSKIKAVAVTKTLIKSEEDYYEQAMAKRKNTGFLTLQALSTAHQTFYTTDFATLEAYNQAVKDSEERTKAAGEAMAAGIATMAGQMASVMSGALESFTTKAEGHARTIGNFFKEMGEAMLKWVLKSLGMQLMEEGAMMLIKAAALALGIITAPLAAGTAAGGAIELAAGAAMVAASSAVKLAQGGIVTRPTSALIGEAGPEAVVPLSKTNMFGDTKIGTITASFPGVRNVADLNGTRFQETAARKFADAISEHKLRTGQR